MNQSDSDYSFTKDFERVGREMAEGIRDGITKAVKALADAFASLKIYQSLREMFLSTLSEKEKDVFFRKERHRKKYYRMMERRKNAS